MPSKFYPVFIPMKGYMVSDVRIQLPGAFGLTPSALYNPLSEKTRIGLTTY
jgi:hypothetical protein